MDVKAYDMRFIKDIGDKAMALLSTMHKGANANGCSIVCYEDHASLNDQGGSVMVVSYGVDFRNSAIDKEKTHTIQAKPNG